MTEELAGKIVDAYKSSPLLTGLLILNIAMVGAFGWWENNKSKRVDSFITDLLTKQEKLNERIIALSANCKG